MDVFVPSKTVKFDKTVFMFVRFRHRSEMMKAINGCNNRRVDGFNILVKQAEREKKLNRRLYERKDLGSSRVTEGKAGCNTRRDHQSYKEALMGGGKVDLEAKTNIQRNEKRMVVSERQLMEVTQRCNSEFQNAKLSQNLEMRKKVIDGGFIDSVKFDMTNPDSDLEWLWCSVIGIVKGEVEVDKIASWFQDIGFPVQVCPAGGCSVLIRFESGQSMRNFFKLDVQDLQLDEETANKSRLHVARILVKVESKLKVPAVVSVTIGDQTFRISVTIDEDEPIPYYRKRNDERISDACAKMEWLGGEE
ncbi:hypothetical protein PTKIN_Ptkin14bG0136800 [Pterospermum kingtungense]